MRKLRHFIGLYIQSDWHWVQDCEKPTLMLDEAIRPGWYMLTVSIRSEQKRCYGLFNKTQLRLLVSGKRRRRLVRVNRAQGTLTLLGLNGEVTIEELRLTRQPLWRAKRVFINKLKATHPCYQKSLEYRPSICKLWREYNKLLGRRVHRLVDYDTWIEQVEKNSQHSNVSSEQPEVQFTIWWHGDKSNTENYRRSIASLGHQLRGDFQLLEPVQGLKSSNSDAWVVTLKVGDILAPQALQRLATVIMAHREATVVYSDEDLISATGRRHSPQFKPAWNPDLLYSDPHYSHIWCLRRDIFLDARRTLQESDQNVDLYELVLEASHKASAAQIVHLPEMLYHHYDNDVVARGSAESVKVLQRFFERHQQRPTVAAGHFGGHVVRWPLPATRPYVSVIIPTRNQGQMLRRCIDSLRNNDDGRMQVEIIVVDNDSTEQECLAYLDLLDSMVNTRVHRSPGAFNYAAINNEAVTLARGELIAFINNDIEATHKGWLTSMVSHACRHEIGAVGAKLLYADRTVQHGGVILGIGGIAGHAHKYLPAEAEGYQLRLQLSQNMSAVTAAALVIKRSCFEEVGGFDADNFAVNYNDVDLCLRLMQAGYRNLYCAEAVLIHHESKTRGVPRMGDDSYRQWQQERQAMLRRWPRLLTADPFYSPHLSLIEEDMSLSLIGAMGTTGRTATGSV